MNFNWGTPWGPHTQDWRQLCIRLCVHILLSPTSKPPLGPGRHCRRLKLTHDGSFRGGSLGHGGCPCGERPHGLRHVLCEPAELEAPVRVPQRLCRWVSPDRSNNDMLTPWQSWRRRVAQRSPPPPHPTSPVSAEVQIPKTHSRGSEKWCGN